MTAADLRRIVGAMTSGPYSYDATDGRLRGRGVNEFLTKDICELFIGNVKANSEALLTLANHADALVRLVEACEEVAEIVDEVEKGMLIANQGDLRGPLHRLRLTLAALHAVKP